MMRKLINKARQLGACNLIDKPRGWRELVALLWTAQGAEFCIKNDFLTPENCSFVPVAILHENCIHVDAGSIDVRDTYNAAFVGGTAATIVCDKNEAVYKIIATNGAYVVVNASQYSVVRIHKDNTSTVILFNDGTAKIIN